MKLEKYMNVEGIAQKAFSDVKGASPVVKKLRTIQEYAREGLNYLDADEKQTKHNVKMIVKLANELNKWYTKRTF